MFEEWRELAENLEKLNRVGLKIARRMTLNDAAFDTLRRSKENVKRDMTLRAPASWVINRRNLFVIKASRQREESEVGNTLDYMRMQEFGAVRPKRGRQGVPIATGYSAGQQGTKPRTRLPRAANTMRRISLKRSRKISNVARVKQAAADREKFIFLDLRKRKGIFKMLGGKRKPKIKMVWDLTQRQVVTPPRPWLGPAFDDTKRHVPEFFVKRAQFQLDRMNIRR